MGPPQEITTHRLRTMALRVDVMCKATLHSVNSNVLADIDAKCG